MLLILLVALTQAPVPAADPCAAAPHHQFDFWIGEWEVRGPDGRLLGSNRITSILGGCALREEWTSANGKVQGVSLNAYDVADARWHQAWVDTGGSRLTLTGGLVEASMVMEQRSEAGPTGAGEVQRVTWTPLGDGRVRQHWEISDDGGRTWKTAFDGFYSRRPSAPAR
jgi:hypothetical protein